MNPKIVLRIISYLLLILCAFMLTAVAVALYFREFAVVPAFMVPVALTVVIVGLFLLVTRNSGRSQPSFKDGFLFVSGGWALAAALGALPFYLSGTIPSYCDAYFESISGFTTTGASILTEIQSLPRAILFWRSLTHWLGGMGIVVLTVAILPLLGVGGLQLVKAEAPGPTVDKITPRIAETAKYLWYIYLGMTIVETLLLMGGGMGFLDALTHTFGTVATGGFSTMNISVAHFDSAYIDWVITFFMVIAGMNFVLHFRLLTGNLQNLFVNTELKAYLLIFFTATLMIAGKLHLEVYQSFTEALRYSAFQVASILTTTGFATADYEKWPYMAQAILLLLMFVGGCSGSTGGGIKVIRIVTLFKQAVNEMKYLIHPKAVFPLRFSGQVVGKTIVYAISGFFFLYITILLLVTFAVSLAGVDLLSALTAALATLGNIGPGFGVVGPTKNYAHFPDFVKWVLSFAMMAGRLELYTVFVLFTPMFWRR
ncbi:MAG: TrkH family potassium uptake protein [Deltaproteobacteria bacterium]|nr:TrkH family potassium uptake protein [Deltaproteobacteria bacterium]